METTGEIRFEILGPLRAWQGDRELALGPTKQRAVLAALLVNANKAVSTSQIVDAVWDDEPPHNGANVVQKYVAGLRRVLEPDRAPRSPGQLLTRTPTGYLLRVAPGTLDADVFTEIAGSATPAANQLTAAVTLWQGEPLAGLTGPLFDGARLRLTELRADLLEKLAELELAAGHHRTAVTGLGRLVADYPLRERPRELLMLALSRSGRQPEALAAYRDYRAYVTAELGIEPGEPIQRLHERILRADPDVTDRPGQVDATPIDATPASAEPATTIAGTTVTGPPDRAVRTAIDRDTDLPDSVRWGAKLLAIVVPVVTFGFATWAVVGALAAWRFTRGRPGLTPNVVAVGGYLVLAGALIGVAMLPTDRLQAVLLIADLTVMQIGGAVHAALLVDAPPRDGQPLVSAAVRVVAFLAPLLTLGFGNWAVPLYYAVRRRNPGLWVLALGLLALTVNVLLALALDGDRGTDAAGPWWVVSFLVQLGLAPVLAIVGAAIDPDLHRRPSIRF